MSSTSMYAARSRSTASSRPQDVIPTAEPPVMINGRMVALLSGSHPQERVFHHLVVSVHDREDHRPHSLLDLPSSGHHAKRIWRCSVVIRSPLPDLQVPDADFSSSVLARAREQPDRLALIDAGTGASLDGSELIRAIHAVAGALAARGLGQGEAVGICGFNSAEYAIAAHAVWRAGGVVVTMNPLFTLREMHQELADARPRFLVAAPQVLDRATEAARLAGVSEVFALGEADGATSIAALALEQRPAPTLAVDPSRDTALILYSSGTTGLPKGVMLTHRNLIASLYQLQAGDLARDTDVLVAISPFFHVVGLHGVLNLGLFTGATIVTMGRYDLHSFLRAIEQHRISSAFLTPPVLNDLIRCPELDRYDLTSLRSILCAAAPLGPEAEQAAADRLGCVVRQGYGMTEASGPIATMLIGSEANRRGSVGQLVPSTEAKIVDLVTGEPVDPGQTGEILVRGPQVMKEYMDNSGATAHTIESDGWLHTGDVGYADVEGYLYVVDRVKEIVKYKAYQVAPAELEAVLGTHPAVVDAAVVPRPDPEAGEIPKAFVVLCEPATPDDLIAYVAERVAPYKKVRAVEVVDAIPRSPSGKILRRVLVERERAAQGTP
jgi:acyl-CoA synthetase (AMP-forming)/AMP-acid ligase II